MLTATITVKVKVANSDEATFVANSLQEFAQDAMDWLTVDPQPEVEVLSIIEE